MAATDWFLTSAERGNDATVLDRRHGGVSWTSGNSVVPLSHGKQYFAELMRCLHAVRTGDLVLFTDWRGDPDELLLAEGPTVSEAFASAAARGAVVRGLIWRSHLDRFSFSEQENRHLGECINHAGGECVLDMRVRPGGSHHQKFVVFRHASRPELDVAFVGGIDLGHSRRDDVAHHGDHQRQAMAAVYGSRPPWHDVQVRIQGPAVADVETVFRERWADPTRLTRNPINLISELVHRDDSHPRPLPRPFPDPSARGSCLVQVLRTEPKRQSPYPFAPNGERSIARGVRKAVSRARSLIYVENQYLWSRAVVECFAEALARNPDLRFIAVIPALPDQDGAVSLPTNLIGLQHGMQTLLESAPDRVGVYGLTNEASTPVYVHAKVCIIDDVWASVGSDNLNRRSWTHDSELSCAVVDEERDSREPRILDHYADGARRFARDLRLGLVAEHLQLAEAEIDAMADPVTTFEAFASTAEALDQWHSGGCVQPRPRGRVRTCASPRVPWFKRLWAEPLHRLVYDPDNRPRDLRRANLY